MTIIKQEVPLTSPAYVETKDLDMFVIMLANDGVFSIEIVDDRGGSGYWLVSWVLQ